MKVIVIGGGASGMMAAVSAAMSGNEVTLLEKNEKLGKKVYITGKGRCNVTNAADMEDLMKAVNRNPKFLYSSFYTFDNNAIMSFLEENGCPLKTERGNRVFPVSDHASDVIKAFERKLNELGVKLLFHSNVSELIVEEETVKGVKLDNGKKLFSDSVIVATGGMSYPLTGSTGDGYKFAKSLGLEVKTPLPSLVPLETKEDWPESVMGLTLKNVNVTLFNKNKKVYSDIGEMLFAHFGVTGPLVLSASAFYDEEACKNGELKLSIDLKPGLSNEELDKRILHDFESRMNKALKNSLDDLLPKALIPIVINEAGLDGEKKINEITKEERSKLLLALKGLTLNITGTRPFAEAIITRGGVSVKEINASTMEAKKIKNLYFCGEVLDIDAMTGGFNLQLAWSTGFLAGTLQGV